jgi:hypothetical protein
VNIASGGQGVGNNYIDKNLERNVYKEPALQDLMKKNKLLVKETEELERQLIAHRNASMQISHREILRSRSAAPRR